MGSPPLAQRVAAWVDDDNDRCGYRSDGPYVQLFWTPTLGPTAVLLLQRLRHDQRLDRQSLAVELGVGVDTVDRAVDRLVRYDCAVWSRNVLHVRRYLPPVPEGRRARWPERWRLAHHQFVLLDRHAAAEATA